VNLDDYGILLRNDRGNKNNWLILHLIGTESNRDAIGARVKVTVNGVTQIDQKKGGCGYLSQNDPRLHFGLGDAESVDKIEINWPAGTEQVLEDVTANRIMVIEEE
jgi:hypothetical protein